MSKQNSKGLHIALWIAQIILAIMFLMSGFMKIMTPFEQLALQMKWVTQVSPVMLKFIGISEVLGALGLILPSALKILPRLSVLSAIGIIFIMIPAIYVHISIGEANMIFINVIFIAIALFITWGRSKKVIIESKF